MADPSEKIQPNGRRRLPLVPLFLILLILGFAVFGQKGIRRTVQLQRQYAALEAELHQQEKLIRRLKDEIRALQSDSAYIEALARRELGMVKEDELVYQFLPRSTEAVGEPDSAASP